MKFLVRRLDQALRLWEDTCFMTNRLAHLERMLVTLGQKIEGEPTPLEGAVINWNNLRGDLLRGASADEINDKYLQGVALGPLHNFPLGLSEWSRNSRRVFHLTEELLTLLSLTSLDGIRWSEVNWPFDSFLVTLDQPLIDENGTHFDTILLYRFEVAEGWAVGVQLYSSNLEGYRPLTFDDRERINKLHARGLTGPLGKWSGRIAAWFKATGPIPFSISIPLPPGLQDCFVTDSYRAIYDKLGHSYTGLQEDGSSNETIDAALRIAVGLCLYLATLHSESGEQQSSWEGVPREESKKDPRAVTREAKVCWVSSKYRLSQEESDVVESFRGRAHVSMCAHWRRGHWRRSPGQGDNPDAPKHVWVRPTLVRKDRLKPGELPGGSIALVSQ